LFNQYVFFLLFHKQFKSRFQSLNNFPKLKYHLRIHLYLKFFDRFYYPFEFQNQTQFTNNPNLKQFGSNFSSRNSKINFDNAAVITDVIFQWPKEFNAFITLKTFPNIFNSKSPRFQIQHQKYFFETILLFLSKTFGNHFQIQRDFKLSQSIPFIFKHYSGISSHFIFKYSLEFYFGILFQIIISFIYKVYFNLWIPFTVYISNSILILNKFHLNYNSKIILITLD
jgi:hypothetical protein